MEQYQGILEDMAARILSVTGKSGAETKELLNYVIDNSPDHCIKIRAAGVTRDIIEEAGIKCAPTYRPGPPTITLTIEIKL